MVKVEHHPGWEQDSNVSVGKQQTNKTCCFNLATSAESVYFDKAAIIIERWQ